jgi:hypothetical protein
MIAVTFRNAKHRTPIITEAHPDEDRDTLLHLAMENGEVEVDGRRYKLLGAHAPPDRQSMTLYVEDLHG